MVEICVNRCTSCIRETDCAERSVAGLVHLLEVCYEFNHKPSRRRDDPPHAKISSDLISCIFINYNKKVVMEKCLPIAVKFLDKENDEMSKNLASYLSLAAIEYTNLLVPYVDIILRSLINGNYSLSRVVLQLFDYGNEREIISRTKNILDILSKCDACDKNILLQLLANIMNNPLFDDINIVLDKLPLFLDFILELATANQALIVLLRLAEKKPSVFHEYIDFLKLTAQNHLGTVCLIGQILTAVGKKNKEKASIALEFIMENLSLVDYTSQTILLQEAVKLCSFYPILFTDKITAAIRQHTSQKKNSETKLSGNNITIVNLNSSTLMPLRTSQNQNSSLKSQQISMTYIGNSATGTSKSNIAFHMQSNSRKQKMDSRSTGRLNSYNNNSLMSTNRSMTKLNSNGNSSNKSITRLSSSQHIHQSQIVVSGVINSNNTEGNIIPPPLSQHVSFILISHRFF